MTNTSAWITIILQSYYYFMMDNLFKGINVPQENIHVLSGTAADPQAECAAYEAAIDAAGGIDLQILGIGRNGHIAFNEPDEAFAPVTHVVNLTPSTIEANTRFFASSDEVPRQALSMGIGSIMKARAIVLIATGADKAEAVKALVQGAGDAPPPRLDPAAASLRRDHAGSGRRLSAVNKKPPYAVHRAVPENPYCRRANRLASISQAFEEMETGRFFCSWEETMATYFREFIRYVSLNVLGMLGLSCYILADTYFVSKGLGADGLAALNLAIPVYSFIHGSGLLIGMGGGTRYAILSTREKSGRPTAFLPMRCGLPWGCRRGSFCWGCSVRRNWPGSWGPDETVFAMSRTYLQVILLFAPAFLLNNLCLCFVRNDGAPQLSMAAMLGGSLSNVVLDYLFLFPRRHGDFRGGIRHGACADHQPAHPVAPLHPAEKRLSSDPVQAAGCALCRYLFERAALAGHRGVLRRCHDRV